MQRNEFDLFQEENKEVIEKIKRHIEVKDDFFDEKSFFKSMHPFCQFKTDAGLKRLVYLCATLLRQNVDYLAIYTLACKHIYVQSEIVAVDNSTPSPETIEWREKEQQKAGNVLGNVHQELWLLVPLIAYSGYTYDKTRAWIASYRTLEPNNICMKIIERYHMCCEIGSFYDLFCYSFEKDNNITYLKKRGNEILSILIQHAHAYPALCKKITSLIDKIVTPIELESVSLDAYNELEETILLLNIKELRLVVRNISTSTASTFGLFHNNNGDGFLIEHRHDNPDLQQEYDKRFGLILMN